MQFVVKEAVVPPATRFSALRPDPEPENTVPSPLHPNRGVAPLNDIAAMESEAIISTLIPMTHLGACILPLLDNLGATTRILGTYCSLLDRYLEYQDRELGASRMRTELVAFNEWSELQSALPQLLTGSLQVTLPSFEVVWAEVTTVANTVILRDPVRFNMRFWDSDIDYHGLSVHPALILVCETLSGMSVELKESITHIIDIQPRYNDIPDGFERQLNARQSSGANAIPDLARAIIAVSDEHDEIEPIVIAFVELTQDVIDHYVSANSPGFHLTLDQRLDLAVYQHRSMISYPFSHMTLAIRQQLALCDIRGTMRLLIWDAAALLSSPSYTGLAWDMFKIFVDSLMQVANAEGPDCASHVEDALYLHHLSRFLDPDAAKDDTWTWGFEVADSEYEDDSDFDSFDLPDACFQAVGPPLEVERYALAVTDVADLPEEDCSICRDTLNVYERAQDEIPVKIDCGHVFHYGCLGTLINGLSMFSNLCPNCRRPVCDRRPRRLKDGNALDSVQASDAQEQAEPERFLQDRAGDVVMTD